jgi:bacillopeptidase F
MRLFTACLAMMAFAALSAHADVELAYDDGTAEAMIVWNDPGNGVGVRFTVEPDFELVTARFFITFAPFWNPLGICVLDANGPDGAPGDTLCGYFTYDLDSWMGWQDVTFDSPIDIPGTEFYVVYLQTGAGSGDSDEFGIDTSGDPAGRSWLYEEGSWSLMAPDDGNVMIRAIVTSQTAIEPDTWGRIKGLYR